MNICGCGCGQPQTQVWFAVAVIYRIIIRKKGDIYLYKYIPFCGYAVADVCVCSVRMALRLDMCGSRAVGVLVLLAGARGRFM